MSDDELVGTPAGAQSGSTADDVTDGGARAWTSWFSWRRALNVVLGLVILAAVAPFVVYAVPQVVGAEYSFVVLSGSMSPTIEPGDAVIVDPQDPGTIENGDVITYHRENTDVPTTHRVIGITETSDGYLYETKGDANENPDANPVPHENVIGSVALTIPYIGYVIEFTNTTHGFLALVVLPFGLLLLTEVWSVVNSFRGDERSSPPSTATEAEVAADGSQESTDGLTFTMDTLTGATAVLVVFVPYSAYVAYQLQTALTVAVTVGTSMCLLMGIWLRLVGGEGRDGDRADTESVDTADAVDTEPIDTNDESDTESVDTNDESDTESVDTADGTDVEFADSAVGGDVGSVDTADEADVGYLTLDDDLKALLTCAHPFDAPGSNAGGGTRDAAKDVTDGGYVTPACANADADESNLATDPVDPHLSADTHFDRNATDCEPTPQDETRTTEAGELTIPDIDWSMFEEIEERAK